MELAFMKKRKKRKRV